MIASAGRIFCLMLFGIGASLISTVSTASQTIQDPWLFQPGDNLEWAETGFNDRRWDKRWLPEVWPELGYPEHQQVGWYRQTISFSHLDREDLAIRIGTIRNAYEIYAAGRLLGGVGSLPPDAHINFDKEKLYRIPSSLLSVDGSVVIAIRVWGGSELSVKHSKAGPYGGKFQVGVYSEMIRDLYDEDLPKLIFASLFFLMGCYFLYLRIKTGSFRSFLWFGVASLLLAIYILTQSQWKYELGLSFVTYEKIESVSLFLFMATLTELIWSAISRPVPVFMRVYQGIFLLFALLFGAVPGLDIHNQIRPYWQLAAVFGIIPSFWAVGREMLRDNRDAKFMMFGLVMMTIFGINDLLINTNLHMFPSMRLMPLGFLAVLISMGISLANRFNTALSSLEQEVASRTSELSKVNQQLASANRSLMEMTRIDPLTGLLNRRGLVAEAETERQRFMRQKEPLGLVITDIDHFKQFNDQHGHACGDLVLTSIAELFKDFVRDIDRVSRWGGEEFVLLFPGTDEAGLSRIAEKLRQKVQEFALNYEGKTLKITMTFGAAVYRESETMDECLERADAALYKGKASGRNKVSISR